MHGKLLYVSNDVIISTAQRFKMFGYNLCSIVPWYSFHLYFTSYGEFIKRKMIMLLTFRINVTFVAAPDFSLHVPIFYQCWFSHWHYMVDWTIQFFITISSCGDVGVNWIFLLKSLNLSALLYALTAPSKTVMY